MALEIEPVECMHTVITETVNVVFVTVGIRYSFAFNLNKDLCQFCCNCISIKSLLLISSFVTLVNGGGIIADQKSFATAGIVVAAVCIFAKRISRSGCRRPFSMVIRAAGRIQRGLISGV